MKLHVDKVITSKEGCIVHIEGDLDVSLSWGKVVINNFSGTVTLSGV